MATVLNTVKSGITVTQVHDDIYLIDVVAALNPAVEGLSRSLPRSYQIALGGTVEESRNSQAAV